MNCSNSWHCTSLCNLLYPLGLGFWKVGSHKIYATKGSVAIIMFHQTKERAENIHPRKLVPLKRSLFQSGNGLSVLVYSIPHKGGDSNA